MADEQTTGRAAFRRSAAATLLTYDAGDEAPAYRLSAAVDHRHLGIASPSRGVIEAVRSNLQRLPVLRRAIRESAPDVVVSFLDVMNVRTILATIGLGIPVVVSEHTDPSRHCIGAVWLSLRVERRDAYAGCAPAFPGRDSAPRNGDTQSGVTGAGVQLCASGR